MPGGEPDLMGDVRRALDDDHPLGLLAMVSSLLAAFDPRSHSPLERAGGDDQETFGAEELLASLLDVKRLETSALLAVIGEMTGGEMLQVRIRRELAGRRHPLPRWLSELGDVTAHGAVEMRHVLGDGDNVMIGAQLPEGYGLSVVAYIDHNLGTVMKDAFVLEEPLDDLVAFMRGKTDDPDTTFGDLDPADARARITDAIATGAITYPPFETDTWPACRPLVEWITRLLPPGGVGYQRPEWDDEALERVADAFFASSFAAGLDDPDHRSLLEALLWFGSGYGPGDPRRWSPVAVEILLAD